MNIPINIKTLLSGKVVESERIEFKKGWNPVSILRTISAFANDFENLGSGYIVVGVEEDKNGLAKRPIFGFPIEQFDKIQKEMIVYCNQIRPPYFPRMTLEELDGKHVLLIWVTAGSNRPYEVPKDVTAKKKEYAFFIRKYTSTIQTNIEQKQELLSLTAKIPFDDRVNSRATINDISLTLVQQHLKEIESKLYNENNIISHKELCQQMNIAEGSEEYFLPKNIGLLMFNAKPDKFFPYTQINLVEFPQGPEGKEFYEKIFKGSIQQQLKEALAYIKAMVIKSKTVKIEGKAESKTFFNYPFEAVEEALANAVYHKNYEIREPIEIRILPTAIEIISFGGPDPSIRLNDLNNGIVKARRYRNRRVGDFLKELNLTEGKGTGIPTIKNALQKNNSPKASYDTDGDDRRFFITELSIHKDFIEKDEILESNYDDRHKSNYDNTKSNQDKQKSNYDDLKTNKISELIGENFNSKVINRVIEILKFCIDPKSKNEILDKIGLSNQSKNFKDNVEPAINSGLLTMTLIDKPKSKKQKYITTEAGKILLDSE